MDNYLKIVERLQKELDAIFQRLDLNIPNLQSTLFENVIDFVANLKLSKGNIIASVENLKILRNFTNELKDILAKSTELDKVIIDFTKGMEESTKYINNYFSSMVVGFSSNELVYKTLKDVILSDTIDLLKNTGLEVNLLQPIKNILVENITTGASYRDLKTQLSLMAKGDLAKKYISQVVNDAVLTYERNYMITISSDLDMKYYFYQGTEKNTTRTFCQNRVGKFFTEEEVRSWANLDWKGKKMGTNQSTIFYFAGGYNCRHRILPVSKEIYENNKN